ncbi:LtfC-like domain-containing protein [Nocardia farcinica]|uniref:LtfC-like domain-containing protein n=1 Tax=Nocardia farcinica TaxID=37329 RepID=UPI00341D0318
MACSCCSPLVTGAGNAPGELRINVVPGDPVNLAFKRCGGWPADTAAELTLSHPWGWSLAETGTVADDWLTFHIPAATALQIPRDADASIRLSYPGVQWYTWLAGRVRHWTGGCC